MKIAFYTRAGCHLCEVAEAELLRLQRELRFEMEKHDVDESPEWQELYGELVPVTVLPDGFEMHYRVDAALIRKLESVPGF